MTCADKALELSHEILEYLADEMAKEALRRSDLHELLVRAIDGEVNIRWELER